MRFYTILLSLLLWSFFPLQAQPESNIHLFSTSTFQNPAFAGINDCPRIALNMRNQWATLNQLGGVSFASMISYDQSFGDEDARQGLGLVLWGSIPEGALRTGVGGRLSYAREFKLSKGHILRLGLNGGFQQTSLNYLTLRFPDQIDPRSGQFGNPPPPLNYRSGVKPDMDAGILYYNNHVFASANIHHILNPKYQFLQQADSIFSQNSRRLQILTGVKWRIYSFGEVLGSEWEINLSPVIGLNWQNRTMSSIFGIQSQIGPLITGWHIRGDRSQALSLGAQLGPVALAYSYESSLSGNPRSNLGPSHEISLVLRPGFRKRGKRSLPFPAF